MLADGASRDSKPLYFRAYRLDVDVRRARDFEGAGGPAAFRHQGGRLKENHAGIHQRCFEAGHVGRRHHPRQPGFGPQRIAPPAVHPDHAALYIGIIQLFYKDCHLAHGHSMTKGNRRAAHEGMELLAKNRSVEPERRYGIGAVQNPQRESPHGTLPGIALRSRHTCTASAPTSCKSTTKASSPARLSGQGFLLAPYRLYTGIPSEGCG